MNILILGIIFLLNGIAIALTYWPIRKLQQKDKLIFVAVCLAIHYMSVMAIFWISSFINGGTASTAGEYTIYLVVPINILLTIPFISDSYCKLKKNKLAKNKYKNRCILMVVLGIIIIVIEYFYFQTIQNFITQLLLTV